jgi:hypothetical protein
VARSAVAKRAKVASGTVATPVVTVQQDAFHEFNASRALELHLRKCEMMGDALKRDMADVETKAFQKRRELDDMIAELGTETDIAVRFWSIEQDPNRTGPAWTMVTTLKVRIAAFRDEMKKEANAHDTGFDFRKRMLAIDIKNANENAADTRDVFGTPIGGHGRGPAFTPSASTHSAAQSISSVSTRTLASVAKAGEIERLYDSDDNDNSDNETPNWDLTESEIGNHDSI